MSTAAVAQQTAGQWHNAIVGYGEEAPDQLLAHPLNARIHPKAQQDATEGSLSEVGWIAPVIVNQTTGHVIDGHLRVSLAISRDEAVVPVAYVRLSEEQERLALATLDPIAGMAAYDAEVLDQLLREVQTGSGPLQALLDDLAVQHPLLPGGPALLGDPDAVPDLPAAPVSKRGDLWRLGRHRLLCGDAFSPDDVGRLLAGTRPALLLNDPPYGMGLDTDFSTIKGSLRSLGRKHGTVGNQYAPVIGDNQEFDPSPILGAFADVAEQFWWGADYYAERIPCRQDGSWLVWDKRKESQAEAIGSEFELCWSRQRHKRRMLRHDWFGFLSSQNGDDARRRVHPTQKPVTLLRDILQQWGAGGGMVLDLFGGSGSTLIAAEQTESPCYMAEIDPAYCDVIVARWEQLTGGRAERA